jgi:hypothetical protein
LIWFVLFFWFIWFNQINETNQITVCGVGKLLNGFYDFAAAQAACANPNAFRLTVDQCSDWLEVGLEGPLGLVIGVTDVMAGLATFATEIACKCHWYIPPASRNDIRLLMTKCTIGSLVFTSRIEGQHGILSPAEG